MKKVTCFCITVDKQGETGAEVSSRMVNMKTAFHKLKKISGIPQTYQDINTKSRMFENNREACTTLELRDMEDDCYHHKENPEVHQHLSEENLAHPMASYHQ